MGFGSWRSDVDLEVHLSFLEFIYPELLHKRFQAEPEGEISGFQPRPRPDGGEHLI
jgi:hypothetical protein